MLRKDILRPPNNARGTADAVEVARLSALAEEWWRPDGAFNVVHGFNEARLSLLVEDISRHFARGRGAPRPLEGLHVLDVGCGAGLVAERLAHLGANVLGIDASARNIEIAREHAAMSDVNIDYRHCLPEQLDASVAQFDVVLTFEVVEHVADVPRFLQACASLVVKGGVLAVATLNRTLKSFLFGIIGAEYLLKLLPPGTHDWRKFVTRAELEHSIAPLGFRSIAAHGLSFNPITRGWSATPSLSVNYLQIFEKVAPELGAAARQF